MNIDEIIKAAQKECLHEWHGPCIDKKSRYYECKICGTYLRDMEYDYEGKNNPTKKIKKDELIKTIQEGCTHIVRNEESVAEAHNQIKRNIKHIVKRELLETNIGNMAIKNKSKKGSKKKGVGRPSLPPDMKKQTLTIRLRPTILSWLDRKSMNRKISRSKFIEEILEDWAIIND